MRMHGLPTRRYFTLGLAAVGAVPLASRLPFPFTPANAAETLAARGAPIAPVEPKMFEEFGRVRVDNYDWLRDRKYPSGEDRRPREFFNGVRRRTSANSS